ncbi:MAG: NADH-quinone oxidoreductase subunit N [Ilumatobacter coccineus]|uniref:NADH-quinone oxidoreductase subunit N n=1 Tax=Ilumatobacter coccineus TaxID=467094 RepID=A0A2G6K8Y4_9ACTN|nr:MAG: NADH-quinone oxidoreductase subunit N [Ilumatobacter coccineus]
MISSLLALATDWSAPHVDWFGLAPELVLAVGINLVLLIDLWIDDAKRWIMAVVAGAVFAIALIPVVALATSGEPVRSMFFDTYVIDGYALAFKGLFLVIGIVVVLISQTELDEGGYYQGEYYLMLLVSVLGMVMMASSRDLISVFVALEMLSIPAYMMAAWRKSDARSHEAGVKYYLLGVFASGVLLFGMSYLYGTTGQIRLREIGSVLASQIAGEGITALQVVAVIFVIIGFAFKVSAVPFHTWAPDTYQGAPLPVTAFLSVASKAAGFVGLISMLYLTLYSADRVSTPILFALAVLTMTVGNLVALRQTNIVRLMAYSSVSQGGFIVMPLVVFTTGDAAGSALKAAVVYLMIYALSNLGAFAVIMAVVRTGQSAKISSFGGLINRSPALAVMMTIFLASLTGVPPLGIWIAKFASFRAVLDAGGGLAYILAIVAAINTVIAAAYYMKVLRAIWMDPVPEGHDHSIELPRSLGAALAVCVAGTIVLGIIPGLVMRFADLGDLVGALGR